MATPSTQSIFLHEKKYPFIFAFTFLFLTGALLFLLLPPSDFSVFSSSSSSSALLRQSSHRSSPISPPSPELRRDSPPSFPLEDVSQNSPTNPQSPELRDSPPSTPPDDVSLKSPIIYQSPELREDSPAIPLSPELREDPSSSGGSPATELTDEDAVRKSLAASQSPEMSPASEFRRGLPEKKPEKEEVRVTVGEIEYDEEMMRLEWEVCKGPGAVDYIPCLDNWKAIKALKSRKHMEHRERHCPELKPRCLVPLPRGYKVPILWPKSRDMIWYDNVPRPKLVDYKKDQRWVVKSDDHFIFPDFFSK